MSIPVWGSPITTYVPPSTRTRKCEYSSLFCSAHKVEADYDALADKVAGLSPIGQSGLTVAIDLGQSTISSWRYFVSKFTIPALGTTCSGVVSFFLCCYDKGSNLGLSHNHVVGIRISKSYEWTSQIRP